MTTCATCRHCRGPEERLGVLTYTCAEFVDSDAAGELVDLSVREARRLCEGDFYAPKLLAVFRGMKR